MTEFKDDGEFFGKSPTAAASVASDGAAVDGGFTLDLSDDDLTDGKYPEIPVGTWLRVAIYEVQPAQVKQGKNFGKPKYQITLRNQGETEEWGKNRKFTVFASLYKGAFFTAYAIFKAVDLAPTKESLKKGAFFDLAYANQFPSDLSTGVSNIFTPTKKIPKGAWVCPSPRQLLGLECYAKVTHYSVSGSFDKYASSAAALEAGHARAFPALDEFLSVEEYQRKMAAQGQSMGIFKGEQ